MELGNLIFGNGSYREQTYVLEPRLDYQRILAKALEDAGFDSYAIIQDQRLRRFIDTNDLSCEVQLVRIGDFELMPYFWGDVDTHPDVAAHPNYIDYSRNIAVTWYKYPMRDAVANRPITIDEWVHSCRAFVDLVEQRLKDVPEIS